MQLKKILFLLNIVVFNTITAQLNDQLSYANELLNQGNTYSLNHDFESAIATYKKILSLYPHSSAVHYNLGYAFNELTEYQSAVQSFEKACALQPTPHNYLALSTALLAHGDWEKGWRMYEHRWNLPDKKNLSLSCPRWDGQSSLQGKKILLLSEGALGDCIQFIRFTQQIKEKGAYVIVLVPQSVKKICSLCPFVDEIISSENSLPSTDYYTSLMSLPAELGITRYNSAPTIPYLNIDIPLFNYWQKSLGAPTSFKIGVCWQADPSNDANRPPPARRSIEVEIFKSLSRIPQARLYSLQYGQSTPSFMYDLGPSLDTDHGRFMDTAAVICNMDLVITVDTAIAHLAGALGVSTWLILPYKADWRWMNNCTESPYYPTMYIFRACKNEHWQSVLETIADTLSLSLTSHQGI